MTSQPSHVESSLRVREAFSDYVTQDDRSPLFILGDAIQVLRDLPSESVDCAMTSPPYGVKESIPRRG